MPQTRTLHWLDWAEMVLLPLGLVAYMAMPHEINSDGLIRLETTRYLARGQIIDAPYGLLMSALALPLYHFGDIVAVFNLVVFFVGMGAMWFLLRKHVPAHLLRRLMLVLLAASMFGHHTQLFFGEVLTAMLVAVGLVTVVVGQPAFGLALVILGVLNTPAALPALFLVSLDRARPPYRLWKAVWPTALCGAGLMLEFYLRRGSPFMTGYEGDHGARSVLPYSGLPGFSYPIAFGILSILFSFGKGLAFFTPGLWLLFKRPETRVPDALRSLQRHSVWFVVGLVLVYAKWWAWPGGWFWGPRFFVFACIPASVALAIHLCDEKATAAAKALTVAVLSWSIWVGIDGAVYGQLEMAVCNNHPDLEALCLYSPEFSALFRPFIVPKALNLAERAMFAYSLAVGCVLAAPFSLDLLRLGRDRLQAMARRRWGPAEIS
jgi:hypothetical protein